LSPWPWRAPQALAGAYAAWDPPKPYTSVAFMNAELGIYRRADGRCEHDWNLYDAIACPPGAYKRLRETVAGRCAAVGRPCPAEAGAVCLCSPCHRAEELELFPLDK
jgi:hypothetical protein